MTEARLFEAPITTQVLRLGKFYQAEGELQEFVKKNPTYVYVREWDAPLLENYRREFPALFVK